MSKKLIISNRKVLNKNGNSIFFEEEDLLDAAQRGTITNYANENLTSLGGYVFYGCSKLESVYLPKLERAGNRCFGGTYALKKASFPCLVSGVNFPFEYSGIEEIEVPAMTNVPSFMFARMSNLKKFDFTNIISFEVNSFYGCNQLQGVIDLPNVTNLGNGTFYSCPKITEVNIYKAPKITASSFAGCYSLYKIRIFFEEIVSLDNINALENCYHFFGTTHSTYNPDGLKDGYIYVPATKLAEYKVATNWSVYETQIIGHQEFNINDTLPSYANDTFTTCTWYSDEELTNVVTNVTNTGRYYCRLEV